MHLEDYLTSTIMDVLTQVLVLMIPFLALLLLFLVFQKLDSLLSTRIKHNIRTWFSHDGKIIVGIILFLCFMTYANRSLVAIWFGIKPAKIVNPSSQSTQRPNANKLWGLLNIWEESQGYEPYVEDDNLCKAGKIFLSDTSIKDDSAWFEKLGLPETYLDATWLFSENSISAQEILDSWIHDKLTIQTLRRSYKFGCTICKDLNCVQFFANIAPVEAAHANQINSQNKSNDVSVVNCRIPSACGGRTIQLAKVQCDVSVCCPIGNGWRFYLDRNSCIKDLDAYISLVQYKRNKESSSGNISCPYTVGDTHYFAQLSVEECNSRQSLNSNSSAQTTPIRASTPLVNQDTDKKFDSNICYQQYNSDSQLINTYGGNINTAMKEIAQLNLQLCLSTDTTTPIGNVKIDRRPRDRDGRICTDYEPNLHSYSIAMGCPP